MEHFGYLAAAYSIIFVIIFAYVIFIRGRQRRVEEELSTLDRKIEALRDGEDVAKSSARQMRS